MLNLGLRTSGVTEFIPYIYFNEGENNIGEYIARWIYDLSYFFIVITILLNLIFGMIIDAFGELRDQKIQDEEDHANVCFICGIERSEFERHGNYDDHVEREH
mmetsp:Transcript_10430/g.8960  ORF Transcript_10430/g.8960 Transcript_10430/m.8960 type:complete len:103 (+) Transcript_10430:1928-2236(+)|eukprot:CAMPEP_0114578028 /NCGR_PEP_ID=MMETSP0125-20121206/2617_1 /TAXON_ID=485358 ORGANISM="Aristerostoma sp., Strain ATCC 50986" /NCGR_SAMPLE_ID=MMETSP0125 /ASSEMBLY_ACC=CAM_ASM_000245 /LENGTH=102 /DNA_ID=CAMNT_0001767787 /DNA_START=8086 /DNA_END=8394 /DNA_ORIENTATION=-